MDRIPRIQSTELKKVNKKGQSENASIPLKRDKKAITDGTEGRDRSGKWDREGKRKT